MNSTQLHSASAVANSRDRLEEGADALSRSKDELAAEFQVLVRAGEDLLKSTTNMSAEAIAQAREKFGGQLRVAKDQLSDVSLRAQERGRQAAIAADRYVHDSPWTAIAVAAGIGAVVGAMLLRRSE